MKFKVIDIVVRAPKPRYWNYANYISVDALNPNDSRAHWFILENIDLAHRQIAVRYDSRNRLHIRTVFTASDGWYFIGDRCKWESREEIIKTIANM